MKRAIIHQALAARQGPLARAATRSRMVAPAAAPSADLTALQTAQAEVRTIMHAHRAALAAATQAAGDDPHLSVSGREARYAELKAKADAEASTALAGVRQRCEQAVTALSDQADALLPAPKAGLEAMMARQIAWGRIREMLEAGISLAEIIEETDDPEVLHAMGEELPVFLKISGYDERRRTAVLRAVVGRLTETSGESATAAYAASRSADVAVAALDPLLNYAEAVAAGTAPGGNGIHAALASNTAAKDAAADWDAAGFEAEADTGSQS